MSRPAAIACLIAVVSCAIVLALHLTGQFLRLGGWWQLLLSTHFKLTAPELVPVWVQYGLHTLLAYVAALVGAGLPRRMHGLAFVSALVFLTVTSSMLLRLIGWALEPFSISLAAVLAGLGGVFLFSEIRGGKLVAFREFFSGRVTEKQFSQLIFHHEPAKLSGTREVSTVTFRILNLSDLIHRMEVADMEQMVSAMNKQAAVFLASRGGYLDACHPEHITVHFGFPIRSATHAQDACRVALALRDFMESLATEAQKRWEQKPVFGIGIASGPAMCGLLGHDKFQAYSVLGQPVDVSRRMCDFNLTYDSSILLSAETFHAAEEAIAVRPMEMWTPVGGVEPQEVYELLSMAGLLNESEEKARESFWEGVVALRKGDLETAKTKFKQAERKGYEDPPLQYFRRRAEGGTSSVLKSVIGKRKG